jgi:hypothetical protein
MRQRFLFAFMLSLPSHLLVQAQQTLNFNKEYTGIKLTKTATLIYKLPLLKNSIYQFSIFQQGIAVYYSLTDVDNKKIYECNYPDDIVGYEKFEYETGEAGNFTLTIKRFEDPQNPDSGQISIQVKSLSKAETDLRRQIKKELAPENAKHTTTIDIDHFWDAFDNLKNCRNYSDSVDSFQKLYLDKSTNGMLDFIQVRDFTAEKFVKAVSNNIDFYQSVRQYTYEVKKAVPVIEKVFTKFKEIYVDFKPFKVCFAVGIKNTGGTVSGQYILIGTEVAISLNDTSSRNNEEIVKRIERLIAHESVHTQQKSYSDKNAIQCPLLWQSLREGSCDFIAELITGQSRSNDYGEKNESKLWTAFKNELCNQNIGNWLYNASSVKDKPADLGYFIGYEIVKEYYGNTVNKRQAVIDIINMSDPIRFLETSKYDQKQKK